MEFQIYIDLNILMRPIEYGKLIFFRLFIVCQIFID